MAAPRVVTDVTAASMADCSSPPPGVGFIPSCPWLRHRRRQQPTGALLFLKHLRTSGTWFPKVSWTGSQ